MTIPLQITCRHMPTSVALQRRIRMLTTRLEKFSDQIMQCHVVVEPPPQHQRTGGPFTFRVDLTLPESRISIRRAGAADPTHTDPYVALRDAFDAARRKLQDYERRRRLDVKGHSLPPKPSATALPKDPSA